MRNEYDKHMSKVRPVAVSLLQAIATWIKSGEYELTEYKCESGDWTESEHVTIKMDKNTTLTFFLLRSTPIKEGDNT